MSKKICWQEKAIRIEAIIGLTHESACAILQSRYIPINPNFTKAFKTKPKQLQPKVYQPEDRDHDS